MNRILCSQLLLISALCGLATTAAEPESWKRIPSTHFIVLHTAGDEKLAQTVSERAETYYSAIASDLGYTRYQNFWLWDNRVKILIYPTAEAFASACQAPAWAVGRASHERREIASYRQSGESFLGTLLPHEMSHLILGDFIGYTRVPLWLTEGFAQWEQSPKPSSRAPPPPTPRFPIKDLMTLDIRKETDTLRVSLFYAQSASLVGFLIKAHGGESFGTFCRGLRDGKTVEAALSAAYPGEYPTLESLEQKWLKGTLP